MSENVSYWVIEQKVHFIVTILKFSCYLKQRCGSISFLRGSGTRSCDPPPRNSGYVSYHQHLEKLDPDLCQKWIRIRVPILNKLMLAKLLIFVTDKNYKIHFSDNKNIYLDSDPGKEIEVDPDPERGLPSKFIASGSRSSTLFEIEITSILCVKNWLVVMIA